MDRSIGTHIARGAAVAGIAAAMLLLVVGQARAVVYPAGGSGFDGGPQGWEVTAASCNAGPLCTASGGYDGGNGNPPGSLAADTTVAFNLLTVFKSNVTLQSPDFTVEGGRLGTLHLERQFAPGSLVDLAAETSYEVTLIDRTARRRSRPLEETVSSASGFVGKDAAVTLIPGHTYALSIAVETSSSVVGSGLLGGTTSTRFDNVELAVPGDGGGGQGGGKGNGASAGGGLTDRQLLSTIQGSLVAPVTLKGKRLFVKARCPASIGRSCRVTLQGLLKKGRAATTRRTVKVAKGKSKKIVLKVKPKAKGKVAPRKRLLFKQTVKAGPAKATAYKRLKLIHR
ncbi:MAG TPA: hypothetical protein VFY48_00110 [Solirubrobacterales bacterium]|nr:hypothetical protein [Solirubrobacterales bacterium]